MGSYEERVKELDAEYSCDHEHQEIRRKLVANGGVQYVKQCLRCGERVSNPIRSDKALANGPVVDFDDGLLEQWRKKRSAAYQEIKKRHRQEWFEQYNEYLQSPEWKKKRSKVFMRSNGMCEGCMDAKATQVHHLSYEHVGDELLWELVAVCDDCHERAHADKGED